jgi:hypothetical protein
MAAIKVFVVSLIAGTAGAVLGYRLAFWLAMRFISGEYREIMAAMCAIVGAALVGGAAMVTGGVMAGKRSQP